MTLTRRLAKTFHAVVRKMFGRTTNGQSPVLFLSTNSGGLRLGAVGPDSCMEYSEPGIEAPFRTLLPLALLQDVQGNRDEPVKLSHPRPGVLLAQWQDQGVPRSVEYPLPEDQAIPTVPVVPATLVENPPQTLQAFRDAFATTDQNSTRYALQCVQLRGRDGQIAATDGRQALVQAGFSFSFQEDILVRGTKLFECSALPSDLPVLLGLAGEKFIVRTGPWTFWLPIEKEGRFPQMDHVLPDINGAKTTLDLVPADLEFMQQNLSRLPASPDDRQVTLDLNGKVVLRATSPSSPVPTELLLSNSTKAGEDMQLCFDRQYLTRAAEMGLKRFRFYGPDSTVLATDPQRSYVWMPTKQQGIVPAVENALRVESPSVHAASTTPSRRTPSMKRPPTSAASTLNQGITAPTAPVRPRQRSESPPPVTAIEQAVQLQTRLRTQLQAVKELIRRLKAEKKQQRLLKSTLASLRELQQVA